MAATQVSKAGSFIEVEAYERPHYRRIGLVNGLLIGLALALGSWVGEFISLVQLPIRQQYPSLIIGGLLLMIVCAFAGWLTSRWAKVATTLILWLAAAGLATFIVIYQPSYGRNLAVWLSDSRFWGLTIYPGLEAPILSILVAGFAIFLLLFLLAATEAYRLEGIQRELKPNGRMSGRSLFMLLWPLIFVALAGYVTNVNARDQSAQDALLVQEAIDKGRAYEGDLFQLSLEEGLNYSAIAGVREQMSPNYSLLIGDVDAESLTTYVVAHFENGAWITCRVINGQLNFCYDASLPYTTGLVALISGEELPGDCRDCLPQTDTETAKWLYKQNEWLGKSPTIERVAQKGNFVLMRISSVSAEEEIVCLLKGTGSVDIERCEKVTP